MSLFCEWQMRFIIMFGMTNGHLTKFVKQLNGNLWQRWKESIILERLCDLSTDYIESILANVSSIGCYIENYLT